MPYAFPEKRQGRAVTCNRPLDSKWKRTLYCAVLVLFIFWNYGIAFEKSDKSASPALRILYVTFAFLLFTFSAHLDSVRYVYPIVHLTLYVTNIILAVIGIIFAFVFQFSVNVTAFYIALLVGEGFAGAIFLKFIFIAHRQLESTQSPAHRQEESAV